MPSRRWHKSCSATLTGLEEEGGLIGEQAKLAEPSLELAKCDVAVLVAVHVGQHALEACSRGSPLNLFSILARTLDWISAMVVCARGKGRANKDAHVGGQQRVHGAPCGFRWASCATPSFMGIDAAGAVERGSWGVTWRVSRGRQLWSYGVIVIVVMVNLMIV